MSNYDQGYSQERKLYTELEKYKRIQVRGEPPELRAALNKHLPESCKVVKSDADMVVVVLSRKEERIDGDASTALALAGIEKGDKDKTIMVFFYDKDDSKNAWTKCEAVYETFHVPWDKQSNLVWSVCQVTLVIMVGFIGAGFGWYLRCYFDFPVCIS